MKIVSKPSKAMGAIKATTLHNKSRKAGDNSGAALGADLANAMHTSKKARDAARAQYDATIGQVEATWIDLLKAKAAEHENMTAKDYDAQVHPAVCDTLEKLGYKMARAEASKIKVAFLAFCHGVEVKEEHKSNLQNFVNKQARAELGELGVINYTPKGPAGKTKVEAKPASPAAIFAKLFGGDKGEKTWRANALEAILVHDKNAKLFDAMLNDLLDTLEIEID